MCLLPSIADDPSGCMNKIVLASTVVMMLEGLEQVRSWGSLGLRMRELEVRIDGVSASGGKKIR